MVLYKRKSIRYPGYDYARPGAYFVTICTFNHQYLFGHMVGGIMNLNAFGQIVHNEWKRASVMRYEIELDEFIIMPNHIHGIVIINDVGATRRVAPPMSDKPYGPRPGSIGAIIGQFKSLSTKQINAIRKTPGQYIWQRNYFERIIRDDNELDETRCYIRRNPAAWDQDQHNIRSKDP